MKRPTLLLWSWHWTLCHSTLYFDDFPNRNILYFSLQNTPRHKKTKESVAQFPPSLLFSLMLCYSKIENHTLLMWLVLFGKIRGSFLLKVVSPISIQLFSHVKLHTVPKVKSLFNIKMSQNLDPLRYELW